MFDTDGSIPAPPVAGVRDWLSRHHRLVVWAWLACALVCAVSAWPRLVSGAMGPDSDDAMRLLQLRDLMGGRSWWDSSQPRMGVSGTDMHWSRLADLPFLLIAWPLSPAIGDEAALRVAGRIVPGLMSGLLVVGVLRGVTALLGDARTTPDSTSSASMTRAQVAVLCMLMAMLGLTLRPRFMPGAFDHHHIQIGLLALSAGFSLARQPGRGEAVLVAVSLSASAAIGVETAHLVTGLAAFWAVMWVVEDDRSRATRDFAVALGVSTALWWLVFVPPSRRLAAVCDAFGMPVAGLLVLGAAGLGVLAHLSVRKSALALVPMSRWAKLLGLAVLGAACAAALALAAPQCLSDPMQALPQGVRDGWLGGISEARPLFSDVVTPVERIQMVGVQLAAIAGLLAFAAFAPRPFVAGRRALLVGFALLIAIALAFTVHQIRFSTFGQVLSAIVGYAALVAALDWTRWKGREVGPGLRLPAILLTAMAASTPLQFVLASMFLPGPASAISTRQGGGASAGLQTSCEISDWTTPANFTDTPTPDILVWAELGLAPHLIRTTSLRPLAGNYHRGWRDIALWQELSAVAPQVAAERFRDAGVDGVVTCAPPARTGPSDHRGNASGTAVAALTAGLAVPGFEPADILGPNGGFRLHRLKPDGD